MCRSVYVWNTATCQIVYRLPGHRGSVNDVDFHPKEPICKFVTAMSKIKAGIDGVWCCVLVLSCSSDKQLYVGELD